MPLSGQTARPRRCSRWLLHASALRADLRGPPSRDQAVPGVWPRAPRAVDDAPSGLCGARGRAAARDPGSGSAVGRDVGGGGVGSARARGVHGGIRHGRRRAAARRPDGRARRARSWRSSRFEVSFSARRVRGGGCGRRSWCPRRCSRSRTSPRGRSCPRSCSASRWGGSRGRADRVWPAIALHTLYNGVVVGAAFWLAR